MPKVDLRWLLIGGGALIAVGLGAFFLVGGAGGCSSRDDVTARVAVVSSQFQEAAAQGKIKVETLAASIKRMNDAATTYATTGDHAAYCKALEDLRAELKPGE